MKKIPLFLCVLMMSLMAITDATAGVSFHSQKPSSTVKADKTTLACGVSRTNLPTRSDDQNIPQISSTPSFSSLPSTLCIHTDQEVICLFEIQFEVKRFKNYNPPIPIALSSLFLHLFRVIVSPNAP